MTAVDAARAAQHLVLLPLFGLIAARLYDGRPGPSPRAGLVGLTVLAMAASATFLAATAAAMAGDPGAALSPSILAMTVGDTQAGHAFAARIAALAALIAAVTLNAPRVATATLAGAALASLAWSGHGGADAGLKGGLHVSVDILHLLAAGLWTGALARLLGLILKPGGEAEAARALARFSGAGSLAVAVLAVTGAATLALLVAPGDWAAIPASGWGRLLLLKLCAFAGMLAAAAANRFALTPRLAGDLAASAPTGGTIRRLRASLGLETALAVVAVALAAWLGGLAPPGAG